MVFQRPNPFPLSIYDNMTFGPRVHHQIARAARSDEIIEESLRAVASGTSSRTGSDKRPWP